MSNDGGCGHRYPGIGDIAYVKDLMSRKITTRNFNCSRFGGSIAPGLGWVGVLNLISIRSTKVNQMEKAFRINIIYEYFGNHFFKNCRCFGRHFDSCMDFT